MKLSRIALVALALGGCGWKSDGLQRLEQLYPTPPPPDAGPVGPIDIGTPMCNGYQGTWAVHVVQAGTIMPVGEVWDLTLHDLFLADSDGQTVNLRFCDEAAPIVTPAGPTELGKTKVPDALKAALARCAARPPAPRRRHLPGLRGGVAVGHSQPGAAAHRRAARRGHLPGRLARVRPGRRRPARHHDERDRAAGRPLHAAPLRLAAGARQADARQPVGDRRAHRHRRAERARARASTCCSPPPTSR